jgi:hypothetical protein
MAGRDPFTFFCISLAIAYLLMYLYSLLSKDL